jgi:hypothetical protein
MSCQEAVRGIQLYLAVVRRGFGDRAYDAGLRLT